MVLLRVGFVSPTPARADSSSRASSPALAGRLSGSCAIPRQSTPAASGGACDHTSCKSGGPSVATWWAISIGVRPLRARLPDSAS